MCRQRVNPFKGCIYPLLMSAHHTVFLGVQFGNLHICLDHLNTPAKRDGSLLVFGNFVNLVSYL